MEINTYKYIVILSLLVTLTSCKDENSKKRTRQVTESVSSDLQVDHLNIWVKNSEKAKQRLIDIGFKAIPDSLSAIHKGQGTTGRYFYFLNGYLELIFIYNQDVFDTNNEINNTLDFAERSNFKKNGASPFSIALKLKEYSLDKIPFKKIAYHQEWMKTNDNIYSAVNSKNNLAEPSIFVVYPELESDTFETLSDLNNIPEEYAFARDFYKHPNGAKKITNILIKSTDLDLKTETIKSVNEIENLSIKNSSEHLMELYFDHNTQGKEYDLRPELPLIIYL